MIPSNLIFLNACPHDQYFQWQEEVMLTNFQKHGITENIHICVWYPSHSKELPKWAAMQKKYPWAKFYLYPDKGVDLGLYISQLRPHILKEHFKLHKNELEGKVIFYHDSDIIFNYLPDFMSLIEGDICWQSNTTSYLDYSYMRRKEEEGKIPFEEAVNKFAEIGGIDPQIIRDYDKNTGGAQYILRDIDSSFWQDIENQCLAIRRAFLYTQPNSINSKYFSSESAGFQSWCADMWAINFTLWKRGFKTQITDKLDFSWATDSMETYKKKPIFHNAGATSVRKDIFYKGAYINRSPLYQNLPLPAEDKASRVYVQAINEVKP